MSNLHSNGEHRLRVFVNRVLRIFGSKRDEVTRGRRELHNEELHNFHSFSSKIRMSKLMSMRWAGQVSRMGEERTALGFGRKVRRKETIRKIKI
jgi:hypothetical protein